MKGFNKILALIILIDIIIINTTQAGSVEQEMKNFLFSNSNTNFSKGGAYKSQRRGYYATPSVYTRNPVVDIKPASLVMPTFRGGCGGIDMFSGSFSHINADQFIALLKAIPSNATGYAFQLALETISPSIADTMSKMESVMRDINNANLNSCELGKGIVNSGLSKFEKGTEILCVQKQMESGQASDLAQAKKNCTAGGQRTSTISSSTNQDEAIVDINYAWNAVSKITTDQNMREFLQTITGTIIVQKPSNDNTSTTVKIYPSLANSDKTINALLYGDTMQRYICDETSKCLNINDVGATTISTSNAFHNRIKNTITSISQKMQTRDQDLTAEEAEILSTSSFPIVAILRTYQKYHTGEVDSLIADSLSEIVAHDLLNSFLNHMLEKVEKTSKMHHSSIDETKLKQFEEGIEQARRELNQLQYKYQSKREALIREQRSAQTVEKYAKEILVGNLYN